MGQLLQEERHKETIISKLRLIACCLLVSIILLELDEAYDLFTS